MGLGVRRPLVDLGGGALPDDTGRFWIYQELLDVKLGRIGKVNGVFLDGRIRIVAYKQLVEGKIDCMYRVVSAVKGAARASV